MNLPEGWPTEYEKFSTWWENQKSYMAASKFEYWECWQASALAAPTPPAQEDEPLCPRPINSRPDNTTMAECILAGECGCTVKGHEYAQAKAQEDKPVAWLIPHVIEGTQISGREIDIVGSIGWSASIFCDTRTVARVNKNGSEFYPKPLYTRPDDRLRKAAKELLRILDQTYVGCSAKDSMESLRAALEK